MALLRSGPDQIEYAVTGSGDPGTVFAHGLGGSIAGTRPLASGVPGTRTFFHFRGHGRSRPARCQWSYGVLAGELSAVAAEVGASRALGASLGAGALCHLVAAEPDRFDRLVFFLPAALDRARGTAPTGHLDALRRALQAASVADVEALVATELPEPARAKPEGRAYIADRARALIRVREAMPIFADTAPVADRTELCGVTAPALVIGCVDDPLHDVAVARELAAALPNARLEVFDRPGFVWSHRRELREIIAGFLAG